MKTMNLTLSLARACACLAVFSLTASGEDLSMLKLVGRWSNSATVQLGQTIASTALNEKWAVLGAPLAMEHGATEEGGAQVFDAVTGNWLRKINFSGSAMAHGGDSLAISGDMLFVSNYSVGGPGESVTAFNLNTGNATATFFQPSDHAAGDHFGKSIAVSGDIVCVGAPDNLGHGAVYVFKASTNAQLAKITASDAAAGDGFGSAVAIDWPVLYVGAPGTAGGKGAVYIYDLTNPASPLDTLFKNTPATAATTSHAGRSLCAQHGDLVIGGQDKMWWMNWSNFGDKQLVPTDLAPGTYEVRTVAMDGDLIVAGVNSTGDNTGYVYAFKAADTAFSTRINHQFVVKEPYVTTGTKFGASLALRGQKLLASAPLDSSSKGCGFLLQPLPAMPSRFDAFATKGNFVIGQDDSNYGDFRDAYINGGGGCIFTARLTGLGSTGGTDVGVFSNSTDTLATRNFTTHNYPGSLSHITAFGPCLMNDGGTMILRTTRAGSSITALNSTLLSAADPTGAAYFLMIGNSPVAALSNGLMSTVPDYAASIDAGNQAFAVVCTLRVAPGSATAATDSGVVMERISGGTPVVTTSYQEGGPSPVASANFGQFAPRVARYYRNTVFSTALAPSLPGSIPAAQNAAVFNVSTSAGLFTVATKSAGGVVDNTGHAITGVDYSSFIGESSNGAESVLFRATISGTPTSGVNATNNEGLWLCTTAPVRRLVLRKGDTVDGAKVAQIVNYWMLGDSSPVSTQYLALLRLTGPAVTAANDQALVLINPDGTQRVMLREGGNAPGCSPAKIGTISRVEVDAWSGSYAVLCTLTGAPAGTDLALFTGAVSRGNAGAARAMRLPMLTVRKGQVFSNHAAKVLTISLPSASISASGAGSTGHGQALGWSNNLIFTLGLDNGLSSVVRGSVP